MFFAIVNGKKVEASKGEKGECPLCNQPVYARCGKIYPNHWSHYNSKLQDCDGWHESETDWHKNWKFVFGKENNEITIANNNEKHRADIRTSNGFVIELQNSPIEKTVITKREFFYGNQMIWIINGKGFKKNFEIYKRTKLEEDAAYAKYKNPHSPFYGMEDPTKNSNEYKFKWSRCRTTWSDVLRSVFIDFGDDTLFEVIEGMGAAKGRGKKISKAEFIEQYEGNIELLSTIINNEYSTPLA